MPLPLIPMLACYYIFCSLLNYPVRPSVIYYPFHMLFTWEIQLLTGLAQYFPSWRRTFLSIKASHGCCTIWSRWKLLHVVTAMVMGPMHTLWDRKRTQWATWGLIRTKKDSFWVGRLKWFHCWSQTVSFWVAVRKLLPLGAKLVSFWMVWNHQVLNRLTWSQLVLFWVAYRKAPPQRAKMASFWVVWFPCD